MDNRTENQFISEKTEKLLVFILLFAMFLFMVLNPAHKTFTYDELDWTLKFVDSGSFFGMIRGLLEWGYNLPLYYSLIFLIFQTGTINEVVYMLPDIIFVVAGVYGIYYLARKRLGRIYALIAFLISVTSGVLVSQGGWKVRPYGMMFCFSVWTLYLFLKKLDDNSGKNLIRYTIVLLILMYSHWFGTLIAAFYGFADLYFIFVKKERVQTLIPYVIDVALFIPWLILMLTTHTNKLTDYWANVPDLNSFVSAVSYLLNRNKIMVVLFVICAVLVVIDFVKTRDILAPILFGAVIWVMVTVFIYSRFVNPDGSLFVNRYFFVIIPHIYLIFTLGLVKICNLLKPGWQTKLFWIAFSLIIVSGAFLSYKKALENTIADENQYSQAADYIAANISSIDDNALVLTSQGREWVNIYLRHRSDRLPANMARGTEFGNLQYYMKNGEVKDDESFDKEELSGYDVIYAFELHKDFSDEIKDLFSDHYEQTGEDGNCNLVIYQKRK